MLVVAVMVLVVLVIVGLVLVVLVMVGVMWWLFERLYTGQSRTRMAPAPSRCPGKPPTNHHLQFHRTFETFSSPSCSLLFLTIFLSKPDLQ